MTEEQMQAQIQAEIAREIGQARIEMIAAQVRARAAEDAQQEK